MRVLTVLLLFLVAGCGTAGGGSSGSGTSDTSSAAVVPRADDELVIELDRGDGTEPERYTLVCGEAPEGDHPDPAAACAHLAGTEDPFAPLPEDVVCTEQYGGPETARITGRWHGEPVDAGFSRTDGCRISQWAGLGPLLPPVEGAVAD